MSAILSHVGNPSTFSGDEFKLLAVGVIFYLLWHFNSSHEYGGFRLEHKYSNKSIRIFEYE